MNTEVIVPSSPVDLDKLKAAVIDLSNQMEIIRGHQSALRESIKAVSEDFKIPAKFIRKMANTYNNQNLGDLEQEFSSFTDLYETVFEAQRT